MTFMRKAFAVVRAWTGRAAIPLSLAVVSSGFAAVFFGWLEASGTADVRIQLQDVISGAIGGLALIVLGVTFAYVTVADRSAARSEQLLARLADRIDRLEQPAPGDLGSAGNRLVASHASVHREGCDLVAAFDGLDVVSPSDVRRRGLSTCRVCRPEVAA